MLLAGDIGGTKTSLAIYSPEAGPRAPLIETTFPSGDYPSLETLVEAFLSGLDLEIQGACFGVAGPVVEGRVEVTNLPWVVEGKNLRSVLGIETVCLLNDLAAIANAVPILEPADLYTLNEGDPVQDGTIAVIAPGTGLGEAFLTWDGSRYRAYPSEGGHADFAPVNDLQVGLLRYVRERFGRASYERIASGQGIPNIYAFLRESGYAEEPEWLAEQLAEAEDLTPIISRAAFDEERPCTLCRATMEVFVAILGAEAGNLALKTLSTGGVYLGGGIPPRILPLLEQGGFLGAFRGKGRMADLTTRIPVHVILNAKAALIGTASYGLEVID
jgi:glucokinase